LKESWDLLSPFIAAGLAAWFAYKFALRQRRAEILMAEKLAAFKALQSALVGVRQYASLKDYPSDDIGFMLPDGVPASALLQANHLTHVQDAYRIFVSAESRAQVDGLVQRLFQVASMELAVHSDPTLEDRKLYRDLRAYADACIEGLYKELQLPGTTS
jgi:hypothetical protein